jgi:hypothetical protein
MKQSIAMILMIMSLASVATAEDIRVVPEGITAAEKKIGLPYAFYNNSFGASAGYVYSVVGLPQPQSAIMATVMAGTKGSAMFFLMGKDIRIFGIERLFMDPIVSTGYFVDNDAYMNGNPGFSGKRAGSNDSDKNNFITGNGWDNFLRVNFKYLLPIGTGKDQVVNAYKVKNGLLESGASGGTSWNPLDSGKTFLQVRPFYRSMQINSNTVDSIQKTNGFDFSLFWDNRDFVPNPAHGNSILLKSSQDYGALDSSTSWNTATAEIDQYISLGSSDWFRQRVIALDAWTSFSPSWENQSDGTINHRPPTFAGATLGGLWRMRAYPSQRFSDKAGIYYGAEFRMMPDWIPTNKWVRETLGMQWVQLVPFVEAGRVGPSWNVQELHSDMKWDAGLGFRAMAKGLVVRLDFAGSREGGSVQMMVSQPFQF